MVSQAKPSQAKPAKAKPVEGVNPPKGTKKVGYPGFIAPALATLRGSAPAGSDWLHEIKFDGYRLQAHIRADRVKLLTRSGLEWTAKFGEAVAVALADLPVTEAIIDGEVGWMVALVLRRLLPALR